MCKLLLVVTLGVVFNGCATTQKSVERSVVIHETTAKPTKIHRGDGCRMLHNGYLVCAKVPR